MLRLDEELEAMEEVGSESIVKVTDDVDYDSTLDALAVVIYIVCNLDDRL